MITLFNIQTRDHQRTCSGATNINQYNLTTPHHTLQIYNNSFLGRAPNYWLRLANDLKDKTNTRAFSKSFCRSVLEMYN